MGGLDKRKRWDGVKASTESRNRTEARRKMRRKMRRIKGRGECGWDERNTRIEEGKQTSKWRTKIIKEESVSLSNWD